jgi:hypothetical protein
MAEPERTTSFAKNVEGLQHEESALDRARALRDQFAHAQNDNQKQKETEAEKPPSETEKSGSKMINQDAPVLRPTPSGPMRQMTDRQTASARLGKERGDAGKKNEAAKMAQQFRSLQGKSRDHEHDRDH